MVVLAKELAADRSHTWNTITLASSYLGGTEVVIGASLIMGAVVLWRTRDWRLAAAPAIAILVETAIFLSITSLVDRERPPVDKLDLAPPTSSYPSGQVGAATALYLTFAILALRIKRMAPTDRSPYLPRRHTTTGRFRPPIPRNALRHRHRCGPCRRRRLCATCRRLVSPSSRYDGRNCDSTAFLTSSTLLAEVIAARIRLRWRGFAGR
jgi:hypothetical protein